MRPITLLLIGATALQSLSERRNKNIAAVALANKNARIA